MELSQVEATSSYSASTCSTPISTPITPHTPMGFQPALSGQTEHGIPHYASSLHHFLDPPLQTTFVVNMQSQGGRPVIAQAVDLPSQVIQPSPLVDRTSQWVADNHNTHTRSSTNDTFPFLQHEHYFNENMNPFFPAAVTHAQALPKPQREACYRYLSEAVGPAQGVQESVGTYRAYMTQQVQTYYDRLLPGQPNRIPQAVSKIPASLPPPPVAIHSQSLPSVQYLHQNDPRSVTYSTQRRGSSESVQSSQEMPNTPKVPNAEWNYWLVQNQAQALNANSTPSSTMSTPALTASLSSTTNHSLAWPWSSSQNFGAEEESSLEISDILESPVLRTRNNTRNDALVCSPGPDNKYAHISRLGTILPHQPAYHSPPLDPRSPAAKEVQQGLQHPPDDRVDRTIRHPASFSMSLNAAKTQNGGSPQTDSST